MSQNILDWDNLRKKVVHCKKCPRLVAYRESVPAKPAFFQQMYWRKPVPGFGDHRAWLLIAGLAPAADGGNRTGRVFTGDASGRFLMKALYARGLSNQPTSESIDDGLCLKGCYLTAVVKCVPPLNKPTRQECLNCNPYLIRELNLLRGLKAVLVLGRFAFDAYKIALKQAGMRTTNLMFKHGGSYKLENGFQLFSSYHPTPRNVNTGLLTEQMFLKVLKNIQEQVL